MTEFEKIQLKKQKEIDFFYNSLGKEIIDLLNDDLIIDIMLNQDGIIRVEKFGIGKIETNVKLNPYKAKQIIEIIASLNKESITEETPIISASLPNGERFQGMISEVVGNLPTFSIRKPSKRVIPLKEYVEKGVLTEKYKEFIEESVAKAKNILVIGGTGTGKTTFANACLQVLESSKERVFILEEKRELQCLARDTVYLTTTAFVDMQSLLKATMRMNPDRIMVGELRTGAESMTLLKAWNSGHDGGLSTIHANGLEEGLQKLELYLSEVSISSMSSLIASTIDVVVFLKKEIVEVNNEIEYRRVVKSIAKIKGYDKQNNKYILEEIER